MIHYTFIITVTILVQDPLDIRLCLCDKKSTSNDE